MITIQGKGVSKGIAKGPIYFFQRPNTTVVKTVVADIEAEKARLAEAQAASIAQLNDLAEKCREDAGQEMAILFETHAMFVEDEDFVECIISLIEEESCNAEYAVEQAGEQFSAMFAAMDDAHMQARAADIKDVAKRILNNLMGVVAGGIDSDVPVILAADDLAPSETLQLDKTKILGFAPRAAPAIPTPRSWPAPWAFPPSARREKHCWKAITAATAILTAKPVSSSSIPMPLRGRR